MKDFCPSIFRQRLVIEGRYHPVLSKEKVREFLIDLSRYLGMTIVYGPIVKNVAGGINRKHKGFECVLIWAESGATLYVWDTYKFFTLDIYTCKAFSPRGAVSFAKDFFGTRDITYKSV